MSWLVPFDFDMYYTPASTMIHALDRFQRDMRRFERDVLGEMDVMNRMRPARQHDFITEPGMVPGIGPGLGSRYGMMTREVTDQHGQKSLNIDFNMRSYKPEEIKVSVDGRTLCVDAKHEEEMENGRIHKEFHRAFTLPDNVELEKMKSNLEQGMLSIQAPLAAPTPAVEAAKSTAIPIEFVKK